MLFDTHAHYDDERFDADRDALLASMPEKNVGLIVNPGCDLPTSRMAVALAEKFDFVYAAVGIHPENCGDFVPEQIDALRNLAKKSQGGGHQGDRPGLLLGGKSSQGAAAGGAAPAAGAGGGAAAARYHPRPGRPRGHYGHRAGISPGQGVFHCFAGSAEMARELIQMGWMLSFNGAATFKNAKKAPEVIAAAPLSMLMIETDAPYLTPVPHREAERLVLCALCGGEDRPDQGPDPGGGGKGHLGKRTAVFRNLKRSA